MGAWGEKFYENDSTADLINNLERYVLKNLDKKEIISFPKFEKYLKNNGFENLAKLNNDELFDIYFDFYLDDGQNGFYFESIIDKKLQEKILKLSIDFLSTFKISKKQISLMKDDLLNIKAYENFYLRYDDDVLTCCYLIKRLSKKYGIELENKNIIYLACYYFINNLESIDSDGWKNKKIRLKELGKDLEVFLDNNSFNFIYLFFEKNKNSIIVNDALNNLNLIDNLKIFYEKTVLDNQINKNESSEIKTFKI